MGLQEGGEEVCTEKRPKRGRGGWCKNFERIRRRLSYPPQITPTAAPNWEASIDETELRLLSSVREVAGRAGVLGQGQHWCTGVQNRLPRHAKRQTPNGRHNGASQSSLRARNALYGQGPAARRLWRLQVEPPPPVHDARTPKHAPHAPRSPVHLPPSPPSKAIRRPPAAGPQPGPPCAAGWPAHTREAMDSPGGTRRWDGGAAKGQGRPPTGDTCISSLAAEPASGRRGAAGGAAGRAASRTAGWARGPTGMAASTPVARWIGRLSQRGLTILTDHPSSIQSEPPVKEAKADTAAFDRYIPGRATTASPRVSAALT